MAEPANHGPDALDDHSTKWRPGSTIALAHDGAERLSHAAMEEAGPHLNRSQVPLKMVLVSIVGLWACYFVLATIKAEMLELGLEGPLAIRRAIVALIGVAITFGLWLILRLFDFRPLWLKIAAALILAAPVSVALAEANRMVFADIEADLFKQIGDREGLTLRRDEAGNLLVDVPLSRITGLVGVEGAVEDEAGGAPVQGELPESITINRKSAQTAHRQQITEIALSRYFLLLTWCALYLALLAGEQARAAERREGAFRRAAKAAELRSLRYQVNPHFLFNTLNSLSALVLTGKTQRAEAMIQTISTFYRHSLADEPTCDVELSEEFALQRLYLDIEAVRFPERLVAKYDLPDALETARVPGMILQPLVENSVKHAVAPSSGTVTITLAAYEENGQLIIIISDEGGKSKRTDGGVRQGHSIGLANVRDRLGASFGSKASIQSGPVKGGYATRLTLPLLKRL